MGASGRDVASGNDRAPQRVPWRGPEAMAVVSLMACPTGWLRFALLRRCFSRLHDKALPRDRVSLTNAQQTTGKSNRQILIVCRRKVCCTKNSADDSTT